MAGVSETGVSYENDELWYRRQTPIGSSVSIGIPACTIGIYRTDCGRYAACDGIWLSVKETALLIQCALFITGIATIIQSFGIGKHIGARLPIVSGGSFTLITPMVVAANNPNIGIGGAFGAAWLEAVYCLFWVPLQSGTYISISALPLQGQWC